MIKIIFTVLFALVVISGCGPNQPPPINSKQASLAELREYHETNCQEKFRMHPFCLDVQREKNLKTDSEMWKKPGAFGKSSSPEEIFGKKPK